MFVYSEENLLKELDNSTIFMPNNQAIHAFKTGIHAFKTGINAYKTGIHAFKTCINAF